MHTTKQCFTYRESLNAEVILDGVPRIGLPVFEVWQDGLNQRAIAYTILERDAAFMVLALNAAVDSEAQVFQALAEVQQSLFALKAAVNDYGPLKVRKLP